MSYLVTGAAGFIGFHLCLKLLSQGEQVFGIDNLNDYYDPELKRARLAILQQQPGFGFAQVDIADREAVAELFASNQFSRVYHLAAQAGVRYSIDNPLAYIDSNLVGHANVLEGCRHNGVEHLIYASSSSVYGLNSQQPFSTAHSVDHPVSLYAATKKSNELMSHTYSHLYGLPTTGLRFFTVYGPWGRPDMALFKFTRKILSGESIDIYNHGNLARDFTYVDDIVESVVRIGERPPTANEKWDNSSTSPDESSAPYRVLNIGNGSPVQLIDFVSMLERLLGREADKNYLPMQPGDVHTTHADCEPLFSLTGYRPATELEAGMKQFVDWYLDYYGH